MLCIIHFIFYIFYTRISLLLRSSPFIINQKNKLLLRKSIILKLYCFYCGLTPLRNIILMILTKGWLLGSRFSIRISFLQRGRLRWSWLSICISFSQRTALLLLASDLYFCFLIVHLPFYKMCRIIEI